MGKMGVAPYSGDKPRICHIPTPVRREMMEGPKRFVRKISTVVRREKSIILIHNVAAVIVISTVTWATLAFIDRHGAKLCGFLTGN